jgi:hypothetical protein
LNPYAKVDKTLREIVTRVSVDGGKCPGFVSGQPAWQIIFLENHPTLDDCFKRAQEIEAFFERNHKPKALVSKANILIELMTD